MYRTEDVLATLGMVRRHKLDVRTVTMGVDLQPAPRPFELAPRPHPRPPAAVRRPLEGGLPRRSSIVTGFRSSIAGSPSARSLKSPRGSRRKGIWPSLARLDEVARDVGVDLVGGFTALVQKGWTEGDRRLIARCRRCSRPPNESAPRSTSARPPRGSTWMRSWPSAMSSRRPPSGPRNTTASAAPNSSSSPTRLAIIHSWQVRFTASRRAGLRHQHRRQRAGRRQGGGRRPGSQCLQTPHLGRNRRGDQEHRVPRHAGRRTDRPRGRRSARSGVRHR